ncbi:hypothetical protein Ddye_026631 [Dipteronia dyeriana]|uniref:Uncharacterized protein n=1 Tax=Dipteronia dyeriana TaxID=168575 RepID=A0AAD9WPQ5_9ROSI|nr:hypothetical protein Ddye_026631 [Dipteronia dyeriana]
MGSEYVILTFDISSEIFQEIDLPTHPFNGECSMLEDGERWMLDHTIDFDS